MTGFGRGEAVVGTVIATVELSSVNRKQGEVVTNIPRPLIEYETTIRKTVLSSLSRGRIHTAVTLANSKTHETGFSIDIEKAEALQAEFVKLSDKLGKSLELNASDFFNIPDLLVETETKGEEAWPAVEKALEQALSNLITMRQSEGALLEKDFETRVSTLSDLLSTLAERAPLVLENYRENLFKKLGELPTLEGIPILAEDERIIKEIALFADRSDITEELTRFHSHLEQFTKYLNSKEPVGRSLDFLCQELNRELNTIGSKANDADIAHLIVNGKTEVEKIREQVQNVE